MSNILDGARELFEDMDKPTITPEQVLKLIAEHTFSCVVAGGYARDKFFGVEPKDIDVCVYNFHQGDEAELMLLNMLWKKLLPHGVRNLSDCHDAEETYDDTDCRVAWVWNIPNLDMDLIFYKDCGNFSDVLNKFDCNLNQFYLPSTVPDKHFSNPEFAFNPSLDESPVCYASSPLENLVWLKPLDKLTPARVTKMQCKHHRFFPNNDDCSYSIPY